MSEAGAPIGGTEVRLPDLGTGVPKAKLIAWLKREGDRVAEGDPIAEVETDKTTVEIPAPAAGVLHRIVVRAGTEDVGVNALLAYIAPAGTVAAPAATGAPSARRDAGAARRPARAAVPPAPAATDRSADDVAGPVPADASRDDVAGAVPADASRPAASLFVQRLAEAAGLSLDGLAGSGPNGRLTRLDVERAIPGGRPAARARLEGAPESPTAMPVPADLLGPPQPLSALRRVTGERLAHAKQTIPHFYLRVECRMDRVAQARREFNARGDLTLSFTALVVRAAALALKDVPAANTWWVDGGVRPRTTVDVAVAVMTPSGLIAPVVRRADEQPATAIAQQLDALAERARAGRLAPDEYANGSFTVSNLGMYGVAGLYPIINPPQTCILGLGAVEERPVVRDGAVAAGLMMTATLSADHRALDGATGAEFLAAFRQRIEDPWRLMF